MASDSVSVLFVCLGNICRSTMAEGVFRSLTSKPPYQAHIKEVDSCGTGGYHLRAAPDYRTLATLEANGIKNYTHAARRIQEADFQKFDYIFAMDLENFRDLRDLQKRFGGRALIMLFGSFSGVTDSQGETAQEEIEDPYYGGPDGFEDAYEQAVRFSQNFLKERFPYIVA